jgi:hypothetical protein
VKRARAAALLLPALLAAGCARNVVARGHGGAKAVREVALFPLNVVVPLPAGVAPGVASVEAELRAYLEAHGKRVEEVAPRDARAAWLASAQTLKAEVGEAQMSFDGAARVLARTLSRERRFDALVLPWLALRPARVRGRTVSWDGVSRTLGLVNPSGRSSMLLEDFEAEAAAPSLQLAVFSADGAKIFEGVGGLDLLHELVIDGDPPRIDARPRPRSEIFADRSPIREGVAAAFDPFLPRSGP